MRQLTYVNKVHMQHYMHFIFFIFLFIYLFLFLIAYVYLFIYFLIFFFHNVLLFKKCMMTICSVRWPWVSWKAPLNEMYYYYYY
jgi:hypothetical protein